MKVMYRCGICGAKRGSLIIRPEVMCKECGEKRWVRDQFVWKTPEGCMRVGVDRAANP